jgi:hypothetical protein
MVLGQTHGEEYDPNKLPPLALGFLCKKNPRTNRNEQKAPLESKREQSLQ